MPEPVLRPTVESVLTDVFGHASFRNPQKEVVDELIAGNSLMLLLATGGGKSLCYQIPAIVREGLGIIISPLVSLMDDQVTGLRQRGVAAGCLHSGMTQEALDETVRMARAGELDILYVSPERLAGSVMRDIARRTLSIVAVDECHVVSSWGHEFRPAYREIPAFLRCVPDSVPRIALTATADAITVTDVRRLLRLSDKPLIRTGFDRPGIRIGIKCLPSENIKSAGMNFVRNQGGTSGIVYCVTQKSVGKWTALLNDAGFNAHPYHAGMSAELRRETHSAFLEEDDCIVVATIAFGMGIDKPATRWVMHIGLPGSPEAWYQEIGRAGRDGNPAEVLLLWTESDVPRKRIMMERAASEAAAKQPDFSMRWSEGERGAVDHRRFARQRFEIMAAIARSSGCRRRAILGYLDDDPGQDCNNCDRCLEPAERVDETSAVYLVLSLVNSLEAAYGVFHLCEILLGSPGERVIAAGHHTLEEYGKLEKKHRTELAHIILQCAALGWLRMPPQGRGGFTLTERGAETLSVIEDGGSALIAPSPPVKTEEMETVPEEDAEENHTRREVLIKISVREAAKLGLPPDVLMPTTALEALCRKPAMNDTDLLSAGMPPAAVMMTRGAFLKVE